MIGHSHVLLSGALVLAALAAAHHWWMPQPTTTVRLIVSAVSALLLWLGIHATFLPHLVLGYLGRPLRFSVAIPGMEVFHLVSIDGSGLLVLGLVLSLLEIGLRAFDGTYRVGTASTASVGDPTTGSGAEAGSHSMVGSSISVRA